MRAVIRFCTAIVMIGICGFSVARGLGIVQFSLALARVDSAGAESGNRRYLGLGTGRCLDRLAS